MKLSSQLRAKIHKQAQDKAASGIEAAVASGELEEVPGKPGLYRLTAQGEALAAALLETPQGQEVFQKLEAAYKAGKL